MQASVIAEFGMESGGHHCSLPHGNGIVALGGDYFDSGADALDFGGADEDHLQRLIAESALADRAVDLAAVGVAADADVERAQSGLLRVVHFIGQQDGAGAGAEGWLYMNELLELFESRFAQQFEKGA